MNEGSDKHNLVWDAVRYAQFEFERLPKLNRALIHDLATRRYLQEKALKLGWALGSLGVSGPGSGGRLCMEAPILLTGGQAGGRDGAGPRTQYLCAT